LKLQVVNRFDVSSDWEAIAYYARKLRGSESIGAWYKLFKFSGDIGKRLL
jgi:hypothetical protein